MTEQQSSNFEQATQACGVELYGRWLETGAAFDNLILAGQGLYSAREQKRITKAYRNARAYFTDALGNESNIDDIKFQAHLARGKTVVLERFPEIINELGGEVAEDVAFRLASFDMATSKLVPHLPFAEQSATEEEIRNFATQRRLKNQDESDYANARNKLHSLQEYWQPRALQLWLSSDEALDLLTATQRDELGAIVHPPIDSFEIDSMPGEDEASAVEVAMTAVSSLVERPEPSPQPERQLPPVSVVGGLAS